MNTAEFRLEFPSEQFRPAIKLGSLTMVLPG